MTDVISYRTERIEELKKLAKDKNISLSQLTSEIIDYYFDFLIIRQKLNLYRESQPIISKCLELIDDSKLNDLIDFGITDHVQSIRSGTNDYSFESMLDLARLWFRYNKFDLQVFDENDTMKFVCKNQMSKNWNKAASGIEIGIFKHFGFNGVVLSVEKGLMEYKISKQKST